METTDLNGVEKAVKLAGSQTALGELMGVSPQAVQKWEAQGYVPAPRVLDCEEKLGGQVTRYELNPRVFGKAPEADAPHKRRKGDKSHAESSS